MEPDCLGVIEMPTGRATLFVPRLPAEYATWMGTIHPPEHFTAKHGVDATQYVDELPAFLSERANTGVVHAMHGLNTDSGNMGPPLPEASDIGKGQALDKTKLFRVVIESRVFKSEAEIETLQRVNDITSDAHLAVMAACKPGMFEFQLESTFLHHCYYNGGCRFNAYTSICGCGPNAASLHYGHAGAPNDRLITAEDVMLCDMGTELGCYCSDITCSFPANGTFTPDQRIVFEAVEAAQDAIFEVMGPGVAWIDMHSLAYKTILTHLVAGGLLTGDVDEMMEANLGATFMPHGLGHLIGLDTHDVGGYEPGTERDKRPGYKSLRLQRVLQPGMVTTVEPGCYFIDWLLDAAIADPKLSRFLVVERLEQFRGTGGVRLEDSILITETGIRNLTTCPRTVADVEAVMAGTITHRSQLTPKAKP